MTTVVVPARDAARPIAVGRPSEFVYSLGLALCGLLVALFLVHAPTVILWACSAGILVCGVLLACIRPLLAVALMPTAVIVGPITRVVAGGLSVHLGDLDIIITAAIILYGYGSTRPLLLGRYHRSVFCGLFLVALSWVFSADQSASAPTIVGISELTIVYILTINVVRSREDIQRLFDAWVIAMTLGSILVVAAYLERTILILGADEAAKQNVESSVTSEQSLFRASYFVTGFYHPQACAVASVIVRLLFPARPGIRYRLTVAAALVANLACIILMGSTTIIGVVAVVSVLALLWSFRGEGGGVRLTRAVVIAPVAALFAIVVLPAIMPPAQMLLLVARLGQNESLVLRFSVWRNVIAYLLETPRALLLGIGPDASIRLLDRTSFVWRIFLGGGMQQGAVDNGYLFILLNYGILAFLLILAMVTRVFARLTKMLMHRIDPLALEPWLWIVTWAAVSLTQQHGADKTALLFVQGFALAGLLPERADSTSSTLSPAR